MRALSLVTDAGEVVDAVDAGTLLMAAGIGDVDIATNDDLARFVDRATDLRHIATEAQSIASDELVRRMDHDGRWTLRTPTHEVKAPSPEAGTVAYDLKKLIDALDALVGQDAISKEAAHAAVELVCPEPFYRQKAAGINALLKIPAAQEAIKACRVPAVPPRRQAKVRRIA